LFSVSPAAMRSHTRFPTAGLKMWRESGAGVSARTSIQSALEALHVHYEAAERKDDARGGNTKPFDQVIGPYVGHPQQFLR
jgi:hypothetical protein